MIGTLRFRSPSIRFQTPGMPTPGGIEVGGIEVGGIELGGIEVGGIEVGGIDVISPRASIPDKFVLPIATVT